LTPLKVSVHNPCVSPRGRGKGPVMAEDGSSRTALIVTDMLNPYDHPDADKLMKSVETTVDPLRRLIARARESDVDVIYVNDNHEDWNSSGDELAEQAMAGERPDLVEPVLPDPDDSFVLKLRHSAFYATPLEHLLRERGVGHVILAGQVTEQCILYSALDATIREYDLTVPRDAVAHIHPDLAEASLKMIELNMHGDVVDSEDAIG
jgi:nicotinamidase-related amidase